jgi:hypothetical protein
MSLAVNIAVIDQDLIFEKTNLKNLCLYRTGILKGDGHATKIVNIIAQDLKPRDCIYVYTLNNQHKDYISMLKEVANLKDLQFVNISMTGVGHIPGEKELIQKIVDRVTKVVFAAGNDKKDLDLIYEKLSIADNTEIIDYSEAFNVADNLMNILPYKSENPLSGFNKFTT